MQIVVYLCQVVVGCMSMPLESPHQKDTDKRSEVTDIESDLQTYFEQIDVNGDGNITEDEVIAYASSINPDYTYKKLMDFSSTTFRRADTDGNGKIDMKEFIIASTS